MCTDQSPHCGHAWRVEIVLVAFLNLRRIAGPLAGRLSRVTDHSTFGFRHMLRRWCHSPKLNPATHREIVNHSDQLILKCKTLNGRQLVRRIDDHCCEAGWSSCRATMLPGPVYRHVDGKPDCEDQTHATQQQDTDSILAANPTSARSHVLFPSPLCRQLLHSRQIRHCRVEGA